MSDRPNRHNWGARLAAWVDGDREPKDRTLFVMEQRPQRRAPTTEEHERREKTRLRRFFNGYPLAAAVLGVLLVGVLLYTVTEMPAFGQASNPINNEVSEHYLELGEKETGASNAVTAMILSYRGFDTLGESCVLFLAVTAVMMLLLRDENNTDARDLQKLRREERIRAKHRDIILERAGGLLIPFILLFALYVLFNGETSPGGGFSGGTILGGALILFSCAYGPAKLVAFMNRRTYGLIRTGGLVIYALVYGTYIFVGANHLNLRLEGMMMVIDLAVGIVVACTVFGFYALFERGEI